MVEVQLLFWAIALFAVHVPAPAEPESKPASSILSYGASQQIVREEGRRGRRHTHLSDFAFT